MGSITFLFPFGKTAAERHRLLVEAYGKHALSDARCREWLRRFKHDYFGVQDHPRSGQRKKIEDAQLQKLLDEDPCQTEEELSKTLNVSQQSVVMCRLIVVQSYV